MRNRNVIMEWACEGEAWWYSLFLFPANLKKRPTVFRLRSWVTDVGVNPRGFIQFTLVLELGTRDWSFFALCSHFYFRFVPSSPFSGANSAPEQDQHVTVKQRLAPKLSYFGAKRVFQKMLFFFRPGPSAVGKSPSSQKYSYFTIPNPSVPTEGINQISV